MTNELEPTVKMAESLQEITNYLDALLFNGELPPCYVTLTRNNKVIGGYHAKDQWEGNDGQSIPEIGINSNLLVEPDPLILYNVLIHELLHLELSHKGLGGRKGYHNKEFANRCEELGLDIQVHDKDAVEGQTTGQSVSTSLRPKGLAEMAIAKIPTDLAYTAKHVIDIDSNGAPQDGEAPVLIPVKQREPKTKTAGKRTKYQCPVCGLSMWGKANAYLICGTDMQTMIES
jgi:hypothetical protein